MSTSVRVVYRYHDGENHKPRPPWYSKRLALLSAVRAARTARAELVFLTDGAVSVGPRAIMDATGEVVPIDGGSNRRSYRAMVAREAAAAGERDGDDIVWFAEDDYLYHPDALTSLAAAAAEFPGADYFTLHSPECLDTGSGRLHPRLRPRPGALDEPTVRHAGGAEWFRLLSTTSTYGLRGRALAEDARLLRLAPFAGGSWDTATCLLVQGLRPFGRAELAADLWPPLPPTPDRFRALARGAVRIALTPRAVRRPSRRRVFLASDPELVAHMEISDPTLPVSPRTALVDWAGLAADTARWASAQGFDVAAEVGGRG